MKKLLLLIALSFFGEKFIAQTNDWSSGIPVNPFHNLSDATALEMKDNKLYQFIITPNNYLKLTIYNTSIGSWQLKDSIYIASSVSSIESEYANGVFHLVLIQPTLGVVMVHYDISGETFSNAVNSFISESTLNSGFGVKMLYVSSNNTLYLGFMASSGPRFYDYNLTTNSGWTNGTNNSWNFDVGFAPIAASFDFYISDTDVYFLVSGASQKYVFKASGLTPSILYFYNISGNNNGRVYNSGSFIPDGFLFFTGDGISEPFLTWAHFVSGITLEKQLDPGNIDLDYNGVTAFNWIPASAEYEVLNTSAYSYLCGEFSTDNGVSYNQYNLYRRDNNTNIWTVISPVLGPSPADFSGNTMRIKLDRNVQKHLLVQSIGSDSFLNFQMLNEVTNVSQAVENPNLCLNTENVIIPEFTLVDADYDKLRITGISASNSTLFTSLQSIPIGTQLINGVTVSKFKIFGTAGVSPGTTTFTISYTDGWSNYSFVTSSVNVSSVGIYNFNSASIVFCPNENEIDLNEFVSSPGGKFSIGGNTIENASLDGFLLSSFSPTGVISSTNEVNGCVLNATATYSFVTLPIVFPSSTPTDCSTNSGTASVTVNPGSSPVVNTEWSTGETGLNISNLSPGAYYFNVKDAEECSVKGAVNVSNNTISVTSSINNASCYNSADGSIAFTAVNGAVNPLIVWSTGETGTAISNLAPGSYWSTIYELGTNCDQTFYFEVTSPLKIQNSFTSTSPGCGLSNGLINSNLVGGTTPYAYSWLIGGIPSGLTSANITNQAHGVYELKVTDVNLCVESFALVLNDFHAPTITEEIAFPSCNSSNGAVLTSFSPNNGGNLPTSISWSTGDSTNLIFNLPAGSYEVLVEAPPVIGSTNCFAHKVYALENRIPKRQEICIVTVDTTTTTNLVVWEKVDTTGISHYNIYRENQTPGQFVIIDTVQFTNESIFNDVIANATETSWRYRISAVDECGTEGQLSIAHKTVHSNAIFDGSASYTIYWDDYEGPADLANYVVWRASDQNLVWQNVSGVVALGTSVFSDTPPAGSTNVDYYVETALYSACSPTFLKVNDFNSSRSNRERGSFSVGEGTGNSNNELIENYLNSISLFPNPTSTDLTIEQIEANEISVEVISVDGTVLIQSAFSAQINQLHLATLSQGIYFVRISYFDRSIIKRVIKN